VKASSRLTFCVLRFASYVLLITLLPACTVVHLTRPVVKIGLVAPFEGQYRYVGYDAIYAARLALREANAAGGVGGYSVELVAYDDRGDVQGARTAARDLSQDPAVVAVIGHFRDPTTAAARALYDQAGLPLLVAGTVEGRAGGQTDWFCALLAHLSDARQVQWVSSAQAAPICAAGPALTASVEIPPPPGVEAVLLDLDPVAAGETLVALRQAGWRGVVAGGPTLGSPLFSQVAGAAVSGVLFVSPYPWPEVEAQDAAFSAAYQALGPHVPRPGPFALSTYQAVQSLLRAVEATARQGQAPTPQTLAPHLASPPTTTAYVYRWSPAGTPELIARSK
jgi:ABC-type branched-subunit amino acid transport system substrate-binding protein